MESDPKIGIFVCRPADRRLVERFVTELGFEHLSANRFDDVGSDRSLWDDVALIIVDEQNAQEFGEGILRLKAREVAAYLPILALVSASASPATYLQRGFDDVLRVPITQSEFRARLMAFMRLREASEQRFQTLFETTPIGFFRVSPGGGLQMANPALLRLLGFGSVAEARTATRQHPRMTPVRTSGSYIGEAVWKSKDGVGLPVLIRSSVTRDEAGQPLYVEGTVEDLTDRKAIETALRDHAARLTLALDAASMGDIDIHLSTGTIDCAHMVYRLFGYESEPPSKSTRHLYARVQEDDKPGMISVVREAIKHGSTLDKEFRVRWPDGTERWLRARGEVMYDDSQRPERIVGVIRDATDEKTMEMDLIRAKVEAEEMAALKSTFLANMSHEIRTPLTAIIGFASLLAGRVAEDQRGAVRRIQEGGQRLLETLNAVLTLARLESRQMDLVIEDIDVVREARGTLEMFENQARDKGLTLSFKGPRTALRSRLDRGAFTSVLQNLISNAIKFTDSGSVSVGVRATEAEDGVPVALIEVMDTGSGIEEAFLPYVFEEFQQESSGIRRVYEGAGLGLAIVKRLTDLLGGQITVESTKGTGSSFQVSFPLSDPSRGRKKRSATSDSETVVEPAPRLLIVEDNEDTRRLLTELLSDRFHVEMASDGDEALALAEDHEFDVVLMDINLGEGMTGVDVAEMLRNQPKFETTPIVALTAYALPGDRERFLGQGFTAHLPKPFDPEALVQLIRQLKQE
jgi:PAS domain S-box-containing protein